MRIFNYKGVIFDLALERFLSPIIGQLKSLRGVLKRGSSCPDLIDAELESYFPPGLGFSRLCLGGLFEMRVNFNGGEK